MPAARESRPASRVDPMQDVTNASLSAAVLSWLAAFERALAAGDDAQLADIDQFVADGARLKDGEPIGAELIVLATGYLGQEHLARQLFGAEVAGRVGPIWGFDKATQELRNMWAPTGQRGLWFIAGSFAQCRIYSKVLALQIKAAAAGLVPAAAT